MRKKIAFSAIIVLLLTTITIFALNKPQSQAIQTPPKPPTRAELLTLVNAERAKHGVAPLKEDPRLDKSAQEKATDEVKYNYFGHMRDGVFIGQQFINATGISCKLDSENLAWNTDYSMINSKQAIDWWMSSKPHHKAMIDPRYSLTGFGIYKNQIVEHFCQPR